MGEIAARNNLAVEVLPVEKVTDLGPYRTVILGSAIRTGNLLPEVMTFIEKNQAALQQKAFSVFIVCMTLQEDTQENRQKVSAYLDPVRALVKPASEGLFAGVMNPSKLKLLERLIILAMKTPSGDFRKWDQINAWAGSSIHAGRTEPWL
jgi:menaquinone-dependent protoporphyrinogen oxidase